MNTRYRLTQTVDAKDYIAGNDGRQELATSLEIIGTTVQRMREFLLLDATDTGIEEFTGTSPHKISVQLRELLEIMEDSALVNKSQRSTK